jgi:hypothetical protein
MDATSAEIRGGGEVEAAYERQEGRNEANSIEMKRAEKRKESTKTP